MPAVCRTRKLINYTYYAYARWHEGLAEKEELRRKHACRMRMELYFSGCLKSARNTLIRLAIFSRAKQSSKDFLYCDLKPVMLVREHDDTKQTKGVCNNDVQFREKLPLYRFRRQVARRHGMGCVKLALTDWAVCPENGLKPPWVGVLNDFLNPYRRFTWTDYSSAGIPKLFELEPKSSHTHIKDENGNRATIKSFPLSLLSLSLA